MGTTKQLRSLDSCCSNQNHGISIPRNRDVVFYLQEDGHLKCRGLKSVLALEAVGDELALGHVVEPVELASRVLAAVEGGEAVHASLQLLREGERARLLEWP